MILSGDMSYSDIGCYGSEIETPNLDRLAQGVLKFTQFYNTAQCCPTRASLLTGLSPHQAGMAFMTNDRCVTIAEALKPVRTVTPRAAPAASSTARSRRSAARQA